LTPVAALDKLKPMSRARWWIRRAGVTVFLIGSLCAGMVAPPHAEGLDDFACSLAAVNHDQSAHYIGSAPPSSDPDTQHCFLCHSLRSFSSALDRFEQRIATPKVERLHAALVALADDSEWALLPGRAPPV
jgi:hypothetical protein